MGDWSIVVPEAATNLVTNPSCEKDTTGYTAVGSALAQETAKQRRGVACLKVTPTASINDGVYYGLNLAMNKAHTFSVDVLGYSGIPYRLFIFDVTGGVMLGSVYGFVGTGDWQRVSVTATTGANASCRLYVEKDSSADTHAFYVDGLQCEQADHPTTYIDGDQDGCGWTGPAHASTSTRSAQTRAGGREISLDTATAGMVVSNDAGAGMPPVQLRTQARSVLPGSHYQGTTISERLITLTITATGSSVKDLHQLRQTLVDLVKPDRTASQQPFLLRYRGGGKVLEIPVVYDTGLQGGDVKGGSETMAIRLIAHDQPLWQEEGERGATVLTIQSLTVSCIVSQVSGAWSSMAGGVTNMVLALAMGPDGSVYAGLYHTSVGNPGKVMKWNGSAWSTLGTMNGSVRALAVGPNGDLYAGGEFTTIDGVAYSGIAKWNGSAWSALGTGIQTNATVNALAIAPDGSLYAGGTFATAGGVTVNYIAKWDGAAWSALGTGMSVSGSVLALACASDGTLYAGGLFTTAGGVSASRIAKWNGSAWSALGSGVNGEVDGLAFGLDGSLYAVGAFTSAGGLAAGFIARWNGTAWSNVGPATSLSGSPAVCVAQAPDGRIYVGGGFTSAGGLTLADYVAVWNGSVWSPLPIDLPGTFNVNAFLVKDTSLYIGFSTSGTATASSAVSLSGSSLGTATVYPLITIRRTGGTSAILQQIKNETTGKTILFNCPLADGETLTLDLRPGKKSMVSSVYGNALAKVLPNSDFGTFALAPGDNLLSVYVVPSGGPTITCTVRWRVVHWSTDGGAL